MICFVVRLRVLQPALRVLMLCVSHREDLLFVIVVVQSGGTDEAALGQADAPLLAVGIIGVFANGVVGYDIENQVFGAVIGELMGFAGLEDEGVAGFDGVGAVVVADEAGAGNDVIEFPLGAVRVIGVRSFAGLDADDLDIEG